MWTAPLPTLQRKQPQARSTPPVRLPTSATILAATASIPRGEVRTYTWVAKMIGRPGAVRAAGSALRRNPIPLVIPCHRVVRTDGGLSGYRWGIERKEKLLRREKEAG